MRISARFCGPPDSGNGGYTAGLLARGRSGAVEVTLRSPPPLERDLQVVDHEGGLDLLDGTTLVAQARRGQLEKDELAPPSFEVAEELSRNYVGFRDHYFPTCFVCGPARAVGDGLRIFPGASREGGLVVAPWQPDPSLANDAGSMPSEILWAALDCVGYFAIASPVSPVALLGRMTAELFDPVSVGERCVVVGRPLQRDGRKLFARTALYTTSGKLCGHAQQTWIAISRASSSFPPSSTRMPLSQR